MIERLFVVALPVALAVSACPRHEPARPASNVVIPASSSSASASEPEALPDASRPKHAELDKAFVRLGEACSDADAGKLPAELCDARGSVAAVIAMVDTVGDFPPASAEVIANRARSEFAPGEELTIALEGERLFVRHVTCGACRRVLGFAVVADLNRLQDDGLRMVQARAGLAADAPLLPNANAWREYFKSDASP